jgi:hypothetical protein
MLAAAQQYYVDFKRATAIIVSTWIRNLQNFERPVLDGGSRGASLRQERRMIEFIR